MNVRNPAMHVKNLVGTTFLLSTFVSLSACVQTQPGQSGPVMSSKRVSSQGYVESIQPILDAKCTLCHDSGRADAGLRLDSWDYLMAGSEFGEAVIPFDAENSLLIEMATKYVAGSHPSELDREKLSEEEIVQIKNWIADGARGPDDLVPYADSNSLVYVANQGEATVNVIDTESNNVIRRVDLTTLGFDRAAKPHHIAVEDDGSFWYVTLISGNTILKFNRDNELVARANFEVPGLLALDASGDRMYVGRSMAAVNPPTRIGFIERSSMDIDEVEVFHPRPHALAVTPDGRFVLSGSLGENQIIVVDVETGDAVRHSIDGPVHTLVQFGIAPDGSTMIVGGEMTGKLFFFDLTKLPDLPLLKTIDVHHGPWHPVFSPDGKTAYFANKMHNAVTVVDMDRQEVAQVITGEGLSQPHGAALSHDGRYLYISNNNLIGGYSPRLDFGDNALVGTVAVISTETLKIVKVLEVGAYASGAGSRVAR